MVDDIKKASEARNINELIAWVKNGKSIPEKQKRLEEAKRVDFYWSSFVDDQKLNEMNDEINYTNPK